MLKRDDVSLIFIDVQGRLHDVMQKKEVLDANLLLLLKGAKLLGVPVLCTEQIPEKLGPTNEPFSSLLKDVPKIAKSAFSCCGEQVFFTKFRGLKKRQVLLVGIEAHICVYQTAIDLLKDGVEVFVVADAVASRRGEDKELAVEAMRDAGAKIVPAETALFALLRNASDPCFKEVLKLIK